MTIDISKEARNIAAGGLLHWRKFDRQRKGK